MNPIITKRCSPIEEAIYQDGFQAGAASRDAEVAELNADRLYQIDVKTNFMGQLNAIEEERDKLRAEIAELEGKNYLNSNALRLQKEKNDQLRARVNVLLEALADTLYFLERHSNRWDGINGKHPNEVACTARYALSSTPEQSLAAYRNKVIEDCAKQCAAPNEYGFHRTGYESAEAIRAMKEQP